MSEDLERLNDVSCLSPTMCVAVGQTYQAAAAAVWDGSTWRWSIVKVPNKGIAYNRLSSVSCTTKTHCVAVGSTQPKAGAVKGLVAVWNGHAWKTFKGPDVTEYLSVSCMSKKACAVLEGYTERSVLLWNGRRMTGSSKMSKSAPSRLSDVACPSQRWCVVTSVEGAFVWDGRTWKRAKMPTGMPKKAWLRSVSCSAPRKCTAVGDRGEKGTSRGNLIVRSAHKRWKNVSVSSPDPGASMTGVSCISASSCVGVGVSGSWPSEATIFSSRP
jgi:hypothetical protein